MITKQSPLKAMSMGTAATVVIRELPGLHTIDLRVAPDTAAKAAIAETLGTDLPAMPGRTGKRSVPGSENAQVLCLAPDWWLIVGFREAEQMLEALRLNNDYHFSSVDVSGQRTTIELEGPESRNVLAHLWDQDLRDKNFPVGNVSQGLMAKSPVIIFHIAPFRYRIMVRSSFALHLWQALTDAALEYLTTNG